MKRRVVMVVGCNEYSHLNPLDGANKDATGIYGALISDDLGGYEKDLSKLLLSPSLSQFREALSEVLFHEEGIDVFTLYFAGHGGVKSGSYYLCLKEARPDRMSATAYPLNALFTIINESRPTQVNIIIDACNAGGLVGDLGTLLKPELIGAKDSPCISLLAAASADEYANETREGGVVTNLIIEYLTGTRKLNVKSRYLDLADIGKSISTIIDKHHRQTPTSWALNLYGESRFSRNPYFDHLNSSIADGLFDILPTSEIGKKISHHAELIWEEYRVIGEEPDAYRLAKTVEKLIRDISDDPRGVASFVNGISNTLEQRAAKSSDIFGPTIIVSTLLAVLLEFVDDPAVQATVARLLQRRRALIQECVTTIIREQDDNPYYLLGLTEIISDLFSLPIRISKILGYIWSQVLLDRMMGIDDGEFLDQARSVTSKLYSCYGGSFVAVSDEQAPYVYIMVKAAFLVGAEDVILGPLNSIFEDIVTHRGNLASLNIESSAILDFLLVRSLHQERSAPQLLANPCQLTPVLLSLSPVVWNKNEWDNQLRSLDHQSFVVFVPESFSQFGYLVIREGINNMFSIGHGIWTQEDFRREFARECLPAIDADKALKKTFVQALAITSSLIFPDRIPWFLDSPTAIKELIAIPKLISEAVA